MTIGQRLRQVRKELKLTQEELAKRVNLKQSTLSDLEVGKSAGTTNLAVVAHALGVSALWLETGRGDKNTHPIAEPPPSHPFDPVASNAEERELLTMFRHANDIERLMFNIGVENVRKRLQDE